VAVRAAEHPGERDVVVGVCSGSCRRNTEVPGSRAADVSVWNHNMKLTGDELAMLAGEQGTARQWAIGHQISVGEFFDAPDFVPVSQAHVMADTESLGETGVRWLEELASLPKEQRLVRIPTITDPRGLDFASYKRLRQTDAMAEIEGRAIRAFEALGVLMTNTCINYQTILPPVRGEHFAFGDTGVVIYSNSVMGARSNFEGGPSALSAGLTGRTPRYGYHLDAHRAGTKHFEVKHQPRDLADWGALGGIVGKATNNYWEVPVVTGIAATPSSDQLKHFGAALASFGSVALFHMPGVTPEATTLQDAFGGRPVPAATPIGARDFETFYGAYAANGDKVDVVVFAAPQLSLIEMQEVAGHLDGKHVHPHTSLIVATSPEIKFAADRMGLTRRIEDAGGIVASGVCFYQSYAREMAEANGWQRLLTNSAKLINILGGYGYKPTLASMANCVRSAVAGRIV
jgi:predicted aconitase